MKMQQLKLKGTKYGHLTMVIYTIHRSSKYRVRSSRGN